MICVAQGGGFENSEPNMVKIFNVENLSQLLFKKRGGIHYKIDFMCENLKRC